MEGSKPFSNCLLTPKAQHDVSKAAVAYAGKRAVRCCAAEGARGRIGVQVKGDVVLPNVSEQPRFEATFQRSSLVPVALVGHVISDLLPAHDSERRFFLPVRAENINAHSRRRFERNAAMCSAKVISIGMNRWPNFKLNYPTCQRVTVLQTCCCDFVELCGRRPETLGPETLDGRDPSPHLSNVIGLEVGFKGFIFDQFDLSPFLQLFLITLEHIRYV